MGLRDDLKAGASEEHEEQIRRFGKALVDLLALEVIPTKLLWEEDGVRFGYSIDEYEDRTEEVLVFAPICTTCGHEGEMSKVTNRETVGLILLNLFEPFERSIQLSEEQRRSGLGGLGLGLTIVRMVARELDCTVAFVAPQAPFKSCFELSWEEKA